MRFISSFVFVVEGLKESRCSFIGSIIRNRRMVKAYSFMTIIIFILGTVATGFSLYATFSNKPLCVTIDGVKSCATSNLSTGQKIGYTAFAVVQWLIDLCEYRFTLSSLHALSASRELPPRDARALTARAYLDVVAPFKPISPDMLLSHVMVWTAMLISPFPLRHRCHHPPLRRAAR